VDGGEKVALQRVLHTRQQKGESHISLAYR